MITKVALAGATGNLGPAILQALLDAGFKVTILTRNGRTNQSVPDVTIAEVDYDSLESLKSALDGHDAIVSTLASVALNKQLLLVEAAATVGVKHFIPSEFGSNTRNEKTSQLPAFGDKVAVQKVLKQHSTLNGMRYTFICNGPFFDWGIMVGFIMNLKDKSISLYDGGDRKFSTTRLATIGKAVAQVLKHSDETKNRAVYVQDAAVTLKELAAMGEKATGPDGWKEEVVDVEEMLEQAKTDIGKHIYDFIKASIWGEGYGSHFQKLDNELLGIKEMSEDEIQGMINGLV